MSIQMIGRKQISIIKIACQSLQIDDQTYRQMLQEQFNVSSCTLLSSKQAGIFIKELEDKGFRLKSKSPSSTAPVRKPARQPRPRISRDQGNVIALASQEEMDKITALAKLINWRVENGLTGFLIKRMGIKNGQVRTANQAYRAVEGLKKLFENQMKALHGADWWCLVFEDSSIMEYIDLHCPVKYRDLIQARRRSTEYGTS